MISGVFTRTLASVALLGAVAAATAAPLGTIDQQNPEPLDGTNGASAPYSFGQSFTAGLAGIDAFEFLLGGFQANTVVRIRDGLAGLTGLEGNVLAESAPVVIDQAGNHWIHFDFAERLALTPGQTYVAELAFSTGTLGVRLTTDNAYAGGAMLYSGFPQGGFATDYDLVFKEGLHSPVPEPAAALLMALGVAGVGMSVRRRGGASAG